MASGAFIVRLTGGSRALALAMLPKATTSPIALATARHLGADGSIAALLAILGGVVTAIICRRVCRSLGVFNLDAIGLAAGVSGSGIGAGSVAELGGDASGLAALGVALNAILTATLAPVLAGLIP